MFGLMNLCRVFSTTSAKQHTWPNYCPVWSIRRGGWRSSWPSEQILEGIDPYIMPFLTWRGEFHLPEWC